MSITDTLLKGVVMTKDTHDDIRRLAVKTTGHLSGCRCLDCQRYSAGVGNKATEPTIGQVLTESFKAVTRSDSGARSPVSGVIVEDEDGRAKPKKRKLPIDEKLAGSLNYLFKKR